MAKDNQAVDRRKARPALSSRPRLRQAPAFRASVVKTVYAQIIDDEGRDHRRRMLSRQTNSTIFRKSN